MKPSSISLFGAALAAIVVGTIAAPVSRSLEQANLFQRDVDGELVDGLFTRLTEEERRRQACKSHIAMTGAHVATATKHEAAANKHKEVFESNRDSWHYHKAAEHDMAVKYHMWMSKRNTKAAPAALRGTRTEEQKKLLTDEHPERCGDDAIRSMNYAKAVLAHLHDSSRVKHPGLFNEPDYRHHHFIIRGGAGH